MNYEDIEEYFDEDLDFCLNLVSDKRYEGSLIKLLSHVSHEWINIKNLILSDYSNFSNNIECMWFPFPNTEDNSNIVFIFLNTETLEMVSAFFYEYDFYAKMGLLNPICKKSNLTE